MAEMGIELELFVLLVFAVLGAEIFAPFEVETPVVKKLLKWTIVVTGTLGLYGVVGHWALLFAVVPATLGLTVHFVWCGRNGIHPFRATPRRRYYELRGWEWPD